MKKKNKRKDEEKKKEKRSERVGDENYKEKHNERDKAGHAIFSCSRYIVYLSAAIIAGIYLAGVRIARWNE